MPRQLFPPPRRFVGRDRELAKLNELLTETRGISPAVLLLHGTGGVGKTALALRWLANVINLFPDGQLHAELTLSSGDAMASEDVLGQFLRALGVPPQRVPSGLAERTALYRSLTANRALAILLDDAVSAAQVRTLLPTSPLSLTVITSRRQLLGLLAEGVQVLSVNSLDSNGGLELLSNTIGAQRVTAEQAVAAQLVELCAGLPVALCVVAARAVARPRRPLARIAEELREERTRLDALSMEGELSVRSTFDIAYAELPAPLRACYRALGIHPGRIFPVEAVAAAIETDVRAAHRQLDELVDANLLEEADDDRYRFHDLVRVHALDQAMRHDSDEGRRATLRRMLHWYLRAALAAGRMAMPSRRVLAYDFGNDSHLSLPRSVTDPASAMDWLDEFRANLTAAIRDAAKVDLPELTYHLVDAVQPLIILHSHDRNTLEIDTLGLRAAEAIDDVRGELDLRKRLARLYAFLGEFEAADRHAAVALERARAARDRVEEATALETLGELATRRNRPGDAADLFGRALVILQPLHRNRTEGLLLTTYGAVLYQVGSTDEAATLLRRAVTLLAELRPTDMYNLARAKAALAKVCVATGAFTDARPLLEEAIAVMAEYGADHERADVHRTVAELARGIGDMAMVDRHAAIAEGLRDKQRGTDLR
ncbi:MAG TPA: NB-ARC domain-containing protein [Pseudonocardiaceae bacterium]|nr:NB-ARC domain-containing protein [Pseudonocardiaceae bacterium]